MQDKKHWQKWWRKDLVLFQIWRRQRVASSTSSRRWVPASGSVWRERVLCTGKFLPFWRIWCTLYFEQIHWVKRGKEFGDTRRGMWSKHEWHSSLPLHPGLSSSHLNLKSTLPVSCSSGPVCPLLWISGWLPSRLWRGNLQSCCKLCFLSVLNNSTVRP